MSVYHRKFISLDVAVTFTETKMLSKRRTVFMPIPSSPEGIVVMRSNYGSLPPR